MASMTPHQQRVMEEMQDLDARRDKLATFLDGPEYTALVADNPLEAARLRQQQEVMRIYSAILLERVANF